MTVLDITSRERLGIVNDWMSTAYEGIDLSLMDGNKVESDSEFDGKSRLRKKK